MKIYQVDAFAEKLFTGNPAAVVPLDKWIADELMQKIAMENNLAETAFYVPEGDHYHIRWFTPKFEVDLCGHATLAAAHVMFEHEGITGNVIRFQSRSGELLVTKNNQLLTLNFPADPAEQIEFFPELLAGFNIKPLEAYKGKMDYVLVFENEKQIREVQPDLRAISKLKSRGAIVTAKGDSVDFVSRYFAPFFGIDEDPVTGSAHTVLTPYWSKKLNKKELNAIQLSERTGHLKCIDLGERIEISGKAKTYLIGEISVQGKEGHADSKDYADVDLVP
jgi:PhzF family phenazine biosynthesis protein